MDYCLRSSAHTQSAVLPRPLAVGLSRGRRHNEFRANAGVSRRAPISRRAQICNAAAQPAGVEMETEADIGKALAILKQAAANKSISTLAVSQALLTLEKKKLADDSYADVVGKGGRRWKLVFNTNAKDVQSLQKGGPGGGFYFPIDAVQQWHKEESKITNGVYLGQIAALVFSGPYEYKKNKLSFNFSQVSIRLGPKWFNFDVNFKKENKADPFFIMIYADDDIVAARGRGGGVAFWQRTSPEWELQAGLEL